MSSCLSGGGRAYGFDIEIVKSQSTSARTSHSSSPSSTLSESSNSPIVISTRKPRTPRKRPNQTYHEAAALLSTIYPNIFSTKNLRKPCKHTRSYDSSSLESSELLPPFSSLNTEFLPHHSIPEKPSSQIAQKPSISCQKPCQNPTDCDLQVNSWNPNSGYEDDFDAESILDEEIEEGIDSIMGNLSVKNDEFEHADSSYYSGQVNSWYGNPMGLSFCRKFGSGFGMIGGVNAFRHVDDGEWWRYPTVNVLEISPGFNKISSEKKKKKKKKKVEVERREELKSFESSNLNSGLSLKLNYDEVLVAWSNRGSPFSGEIPANELDSDAIVCSSSPAGNSKSQRI